MQRFQRIVSIFVFLAVAAFGQVVPGRYVVELTGSPLGAEARTKGKAALASRLAQIHSEQARVTTLVEQNHGKVLSSVESLMNALIVTIPDQSAAALAKIPGVKKVYPVHRYRIDLDHALPIHGVPDAWTFIGGKDKAGAGVKIAMLDTGITPSHPGFQDPTLMPPSGFPQASSTANLALTNNKIIVARSYENIYQETVPDSALDTNGHGTATAMCAAGVTNSGPYATITGVAPKAWIGDYKIVPGNSGNADTDVILKALDDALADGMDVINLSFGSPYQFPDGPDELPAEAADRLAQYGVIMVVAAGNNGPNLNTMGDFASLASVITAGAMQSDRQFLGSVAAAGTTYQAFPSDGPAPAPLTSTVFDVSTVDPTGLLCSPLPAGAAAGQIAFVLRGTCTFQQKVTDAQAGGAIAVILYNNVPGSPGSFTIGGANVPTVMLSNADGLTLQAAVDSQPSSAVTVTFNGIATPEDSNVLASFSSRGPNYDYTIKPDLIAVGTDVYTAVQSIDPTGEIYNATGYASLSGTSFSSPLVAGAAAVLVGARPGLSVAEYRSLIINSASPLILDNGWVARVQQAGTGVLKLNQALQSNIAAFPTSLTYGIGDGTLGGATTGDFDQLTLTNVGTTADVFQLSAIAFDSAPPLQFSVNPSDQDPANTLSLNLNPGQSITVYAFWTANGLVPGEYQGDIDVQSSNSNALVPYWYGVPFGTPAAIDILSSLPTEASAGTTIPVYVRVVDSIGYAITDIGSLAFQGSASSGGGSVNLAPLLYFPNILEIDFTLGPRPGTNTYSVTFGALPPTQVTIVGN